MSGISLLNQFSDDSEPAHRRYQRMFVGSESIGALLRYELVCALGALPGALGFWLRAKGYRYLLESIGPGSLLGRGIVLRCPGRIRMGRHVIVDDHVVLDAKGSKSRIVLGDRILIGRFTVLSCADAEIELGNQVSIGPFCHFASKSRIVIGSNVGIGADVHLMAGGYRHTDPALPVIAQERVSHGIVIGDNAWIGVGARILDGVTVGRNSIVGAGAVVVKDVPPFTTVLGNPARAVQRREVATAVEA